MLGRPLADRVALVTGALRGVGAAIALRLATDGATVVVNYVRDRTATDTLVAAIHAAGGKALAIAADLSEPDEIPDLIDKVAACYGRIDLLVNNAGRGSGNMPTIQTATVTNFDEVFNLYTRGVFLTVHEAL